MTANDDNEEAAVVNARHTARPDITFMDEINSTELVDAGVSTDRSKRQCVRQWRGVVDVGKSLSVVDLLDVTSRR